MKDLILISGFLPSASVPSGGQRIVSEVLSRLCSEYRVHLICFCNETEREFVNTDDFRHCFRHTIIPVTRLNRIAAAILIPAVPLLASVRAMLGRATLRRWLSELDEDTEVWIEFTQAAELLRFVPEFRRTTLVVHDIYANAYERKQAFASGFRKLLVSRELQRIRKWEEAVFKRPTHVFTLTEKDQKAIAATTGRSDIEVRYPESNAALAGIDRGRTHQTKGTMLFWGLMSRHENEDAVVWFCKSIFSKILTRCPEAQLFIAGADPTAKVVSLGCGNIHVLGFVEDPRDLFMKMEMAVAPLRLGSGIKIKVLDYLAAGLPTVATPVGAEGVKPQELLKVVENEEQFAEACIAELRKSGS